MEESRFPLLTASSPPAAAAAEDSITVADDDYPPPAADHALNGGLLAGGAGSSQPPPARPHTTNPNPRLASLDIFRGFTVAVRFDLSLNLLLVCGHGLMIGVLVCAADDFGRRRRRRFPVDQSLAVVRRHARRLRLALLPLRRRCFRWTRFQGWAKNCSSSLCVHF